MVDARPGPGCGERWSTRILEAIDADTAVVTMGAVHWTDGTVFDIDAIGARAREVGAYLIIDGTQSVGAMDFDVARIQPDALICSGYKWLMGPYSIGLAYFGPRLLDGIPLEETWIGREGSRDFAGLAGNYPDSYEPGATRYDVGERSNFILVPMMNAALALVLDWTPARIGEYCGNLTAVLTEQRARRRVWSGGGVVAGPASLRTAHAPRPGPESGERGAGRPQRARVAARKRAPHLAACLQRRGGHRRALGRVAVRAPGAGRSKAPLLSGPENAGPSTGVLVEHGARRLRRGVEMEARDRSAEHRAIPPPEMVVPVHVAVRTLEYAEALVAVRVARPQYRGLAHDALAFDFVIARHGIVDQPVAPEELCRLGAHVLDRDVVHEDVPPGAGIGMFGRVPGAHRDRHRVRFNRRAARLGPGVNRGHAVPLV